MPTEQRMENNRHFCFTVTLRKKKMALCQSESELDKIFSELRANNHCTPQTPKCFGLSETFCLTWNERFYFRFKQIQIFYEIREICIWKQLQMRKSKPFIFKMSK